LTQLEENLKLEEADAQRNDPISTEEMRRRLSTNDIDGDEDL
jgi:hypothetical protein